MNKSNSSVLYRNDLSVLTDKSNNKKVAQEINRLVTHGKNLGYFVEIEASSPKALKEIEEELGLSNKEFVRDAGYPDLLREKLKSK